MAGLGVRALGKCYKHYGHGLDRLAEWATARRIRRHVPVWVLRGVSFEVRPGEALGIVGANASGKTTLLKLIKGTIRPSEGEVWSEGRIAALELGLGFHPEFSGRENAFTAGALMGLDPATVAALMPEIEAFAEIGSYIDDPVRTYSSGMQLRLAFSVATAVRPEILLIDEALAVGDVYFQQKCVARIRQFREQGTTLLLVSHDPAAVKTLCDRALLLDEGLPVREGPPAAVLDYYNAIIARRTTEYEIRQSEAIGPGHGETRSGDRRAVIEGVELVGEAGPARVFAVGSPMRVRVDGRAAQALDDLTVGISIRDRLGNEMFGTNTHHLGLAAAPVAAGERFRAEFELPVNLGCGNYSVTTALHAGRVHLEASYDWWDNARVFQVIPGSEPPFVGGCYLPTGARFETLG